VVEQAIEVGDAVRAIGVPSEQIFVTTKICEPCFTRDEAMHTVEQSMRQLRLGVRWPRAVRASS